MTLRARPVALLGVVLGLLVGVVAAIAIPQTRADTPATAPSAAPPPTIDPGSNTVVRVAPAQPSHADVALRPTGPVRIEARAADPLGGPEWAVRVFAAERVTRPALRRHGVDPVISHSLCAQLGRIHDGAFGWLEADGTFRPTPISDLGGNVTSECGSRLPDRHRQPSLLTLSPITAPSAPAARVKSTIAWGVAGSGARSLTVKLGDRAVRPTATAHHAFVIASGPELDQHQITATVTYVGGGPVSLPRPRGGRVFAGVDPGATGAEAPRVAARAPDPNGGLPFAMIAARNGSGGGWCTSTGGRVVGDRVGGVDYRRDILTETSFSGGGGCSGGGPQLARIYKEHPVLMGWSGGGPLPEEGEDTGGTGRVARRTQPGLTTFTGTAAPGVVAVTLETPRDVRTLIPSGPTHAIMAVYDGSFPTGGLKITARFEDGHVQTDRIANLGF